MLGKCGSETISSLIIVEIKKTRFIVHGIFDRTLKMSLL